MADTTLEDAIYSFVAQKGETTMADIQQLVTTNQLNVYDVNIALKRLLNTGRIYYLRSGVMVANPKKAGALGQVQPGIKTGAWEQQKQSDWSKASNWTGMGFGPDRPPRRMTL